MKVKIKLTNGDVMTLPMIDGLYNWKSIINHQKAIQNEKE